MRKVSANLSRKETEVQRECTVTCVVKTSAYFLALVSFYVLKWWTLNTSSEVMAKLATIGHLLDLLKIRFIGLNRRASGTKS